MKFNKNMTIKEAKKLVEKEMWDKMIKTGLLTGITCVVNDEGVAVIYAHDLNKAYGVAKEGRDPYDWEFD